MRLTFLELNGFRGYRKPIRIEFGEQFTVIDGRNGVGKSTVFDAIEFTLTGQLSKYNDAKASGETVADYVWWTGEGTVPAERYVELGFAEGEAEITIRREEFKEPDSASLKALVEKLCEVNLAPAAPLNQLCASAIIRDEHITSLSLDLKETDRYALLRDALGANDADMWIERGAKLAGLAKRRTASVEQEVTVANADVAAAARRLDELRAGLVGEKVVGDAVERLRAFSNSVVAPDQLAGPVREKIAAVGGEIEELQSIANQWAGVQTERLGADALSKVVDTANAERLAAALAFSTLPSTPDVPSASSLAEDARSLVALASLGRKIGLRDGHCPLCAKGQAHEEFEHGIHIAEDTARRLNENAARAAEYEQKRRSAEARLVVAKGAAEAAESARNKLIGIIKSFDDRRNASGIANDATIEQVTERIASLRQAREVAQKDLRVLETLRLNADFERAQRAEADSKTRLLRAQERFGRARKAEAGAQALHDAARRAASETLDRRLERVLPLMSELYRRLRPHPVWTDIEYSIRGDVRKFLKLQVGNDLNPQFLFSSGQRRATGLAFLLSVNLSLAWSRWRSILLDDPVQHVDDFRTVHLAELCAQLVAEGRQIICAVEDAALADLLCRRLPIERPQSAKRITLGADAEGALAKVGERWLTPQALNSLLPEAENAA